VYSVCTHTEYASSGPWVSGPRVLGPWYSGPLNIVFLTTRSQSLKKQEQNQNYS